MREDSGLFGVFSHSNIVGYQTSDTLPGGALITYGAMFQNTTGSGLSISNITLSSGCPADGSTYIMWWEGKWEKAYWVELDFNPNDIGWGDFDDWLPLGKTFEVGEAFFIQASSLATAPSITAAGEVLNPSGVAGYGIPLPKGALTFLTNPFPGVIALDAISLSSGCPADGSTYLMWWEGKWEKAYWVELDFNPNNIGWGDFDDWLPITKTMAKGEGYFVQASSMATEPEMVFPNPLATPAP